jgi:hypothetical protein
LNDRRYHAALSLIGAVRIGFVFRVDRDAKPAMS